MSNITQEQVLELASNPRFNNVVKQFVRDQSTYISGLDGTPGNTAGLTVINWGKQRTIAKAVVLHPNSQDYSEWATQFSMLLKGQDVWSADADGTITAMIASGKFEELANLTFATRAERVEF